jgi:NADH-quinone oxidoreductase subunit G
MADTITIKIDGKEIQCQPGERVLDLALAHGIHIPYYCYHPGLSVSGNCRMCLTKSSKSWKPVISCATQVEDGLEIDTRSEEVQKMQEAIMEFLLINHPLDCPVCDQAGECGLQDYAHRHGRDTGRFVDEKNRKPDIVVGPEVALWQQRCIACSRCIRFCDEISGTGELRFTKRGDRVSIETFPGVPLDNPLSGNVVDICPVGALVSRDFLYKARVWNLRRHETLCPGCSRGCNVHADIHATKWDPPEVARLVPRENRQVNDWWMCDFGRKEKDFVGGTPDAPRLEQAHEEEVLEALRDMVDRQKGKLAIIGSLWQTVEELYLLQKLAAHLEAPVGLMSRPEGQGYRFPGGFVIAEDRNPNRAGARMLLGDEVVSSGLTRIAERVRGGSIKAAIVFHSVPNLTSEWLLLDTLGSLEEFCAVAVWQDELARKARWLLPGVTWAEKDGSYINDGGLLQKLRAALPSPGRARPDLEHLQTILKTLGAFDQEGISSAGILRLAAEEIEPLATLTQSTSATAGASK